MAHRFPPIPPSELKGDQITIHNEMLEGADKMFAGQFIYQRKDGALIGPFAPMMYTPLSLARHFFGLAGSLASIPGFSAAARETAIIATGAQFGCKYEMYAHEGIAEKTGALSKKQIEKLAAGQCPAPGDGDPAEDEAIRVTYAVTVALINNRGPLEDGLWAKAATTFGKEAVAALVNYVGLYCYTCVVLNAFDVPVPAADEGK